VLSAKAKMVLRDDTGRFGDKNLIDEPPAPTVEELELLRLNRLRAENNIKQHELLGKLYIRGKVSREAIETSISNAYDQEAARKAVNSGREEEIEKRRNQ